MAHPRNKTDPIYWKLTPVGYHYQNRQDTKFVGTGFYYYHQWGMNELYDDTLPEVGPYLVTNKHVVLPEDSSPPDALHIYIRNSRDIQELTRMTVPLYEKDKSPCWREHPENPNIDIAVVPLDFEVPESCAFHKENLAQSATASGGDRIQVIGYPDSLEEFNRLPIQRNALVSSPYKLAYYDNPFFYIDARLHDGMSGSPVVSQEQETEMSVKSVSGASKTTKEVVEE